MRARVASVLPSGLPLLAFLAGTICLLLCNFSSPFTDELRLFALRGYSGTTHFGLWGYCFPDYTERHETGNIFRLAGCTEPKVGYAMGHDVVDALRSSSMQSSLSAPHTAALVLYPIASLFTCAALVLCVMIYLTRLGRWGGPRSMRVVTSTRIFLFSVFTLIITFTTFVVAISVALRVKLRTTQMGDVTFVWGNVVWLTAVTVFGHFSNCYIMFTFRERLKDLEPPPSDAHSQHNDK